MNVLAWLVAPEVVAPVRADVTGRSSCTRARESPPVSRSRAAPVHRPRRARTRCGCGAEALSRPGFVEVGDPSGVRREPHRVRSSGRGFLCGSRCTTIRTGRAGSTYRRRGAARPGGPVVSRRRGRLGARSAPPGPRRGRPRVDARSVLEGRRPRRRRSPGRRPGSRSSSALHVVGGSKASGERLSRLLTRCSSTDHNLGAHVWARNLRRSANGRCSRSTWGGGCAGFSTLGPRWIRCPARRSAETSVRSETSLALEAQPGRGSTS